MFLVLNLSENSSKYEMRDDKRQTRTKKERERVGECTNKGSELGEKFFASDVSTYKTSLLEKLGGFGGSSWCSWL